MTNWKTWRPDTKKWVHPYYESELVLVKTVDGYIMEGQLLQDESENYKWYVRTIDEMYMECDIVGWMPIPE